MFDLEYLNDADELFTDTCTNQWLDALDAFESGDKSRLVALLKCGYPIPKNMRPHIGDMLDRWDFKKPKHKMRVPSHRMTDKEVELYQVNGKQRRERRIKAREYDAKRRDAKSLYAKGRRKRANPVAG
jgi:hypothetical protein